MLAVFDFIYLLWWALSPGAEFAADWSGLAYRMWGLNLASLCVHKSSVCVGGFLYDRINGYIYIFTVAFHHGVSQPAINILIYIKMAFVFSIWLLIFLGHKRMYEIFLNILYNGCQSDSTFTHICMENMCTI